MRTEGLYLKFVRRRGEDALCVGRCTDLFSTLHFRLSRQVG